MSYYIILGRYWGSTLERYERIIDSSYWDNQGTESIKDRVEVDVGGEKRFVLQPNPRKLTKLLHFNEEKSNAESTTSTHLVMQMGQFVDHDITLAPERGYFWIISSC